MDKIQKLLQTVALCLIGSMCLTGCGDNSDELQQYIAKIKNKRPGAIEPVPEIKPYSPFAYTAANMRDPFQPYNAAITKGHPNVLRPKEALEAFPLDSLHLVGILVVQNKTWAVISAPNGSVYRAAVGNYIGQNYGQITDVNDEGVKVVESLPTGNGWIKRAVTITLSQSPSETNGPVKP